MRFVRKDRVAIVQRARGGRQQSWHDQPRSTSQSKPSTLLSLPADSNARNRSGSRIDAPERCVSRRKAGTTKCICRSPMRKRSGYPAQAQTLLHRHQLRVESTRRNNSRSGSHGPYRRAGLCKPTTRPSLSARPHRPCSKRAKTMPNTCVPLLEEALLS